MKKALRNVVLLAVGGLSATYVVAKLNSRETLKEIVERVWDKNKDQISHDLHLNKTPVLVFKKSDDNDSTMWVMHSEQVKRSLFESIILSCTPEYTIYVDLNVLNRTLKGYSLYMLRKRTLKESLIKCLLLHECRHIWQAQDGFHVGERRSRINFNVLQGHGESRAETDANNYAISKASDKKELALFKLLKQNQDRAGKICFSVSKEEVAVRNEFLSYWNPLLRPFFNITKDKEVK